MKILFSVLAILIGVFLVVYGGIDDSPGGQLIGLVLIVTGIVGLMRSKTKTLRQRRVGGER
jgi:hypothetical protein